MAKKLDLGGEGKRTYQRRRKVRLSVAVPESIEKELREAAEEFGVSISSIVTEVLKNYRGSFRKVAKRMVDEM